MIVEDTIIVAKTRDWIGAVVVGLNFCPFARPVLEANRIRYALSDAVDAESLSHDLQDELLRLSNTDRAAVETTLLIHPHALPHFPDYNDFLADTDDVLERLGLVGVIQIASFHPHYQFEGTGIDDAENATNRSPFPMLHLLREASVTEVNDEAKVAAIPRRNVALLRRLGWAAIPERFRPA
jgi:uncharacterized protein